MGRSVNDGINKDLYQNKEIKISYPTVDTLAQRVWELGIGVALFKKDLVAAFRQLMTDPFDYSLMMYKWEDEYWVDLAVAMGLISAPSCCQRLSDALTYIHTKAGFWLMNYIDDFIGAEKWTMVFDSYDRLTQLFEATGAKEAPEKSSPPDTQVVCLGTLFNTLDMSISVLPTRMHEIMGLLGEWRFKTSATRREIGKSDRQIAIYHELCKTGTCFHCTHAQCTQELPGGGQTPSG